MPQKYRRMADFHEYYSGARVAPYLTIFIGGNHEASNYLFELYYGGWVAPNIYYMGAANILRLGPLRIAGLSGIWKGYDYRKAHFERLPYSRDDYHSIFHVRELDVRKLLSVRSQVDIGLSHDWPKGVEWRGQHRWLFNKKDRFEADAINGTLGSVAAAQCLGRLRPAYWFSAHLHIKYPALIQHEQPGDFNDTASTLVNSEMNSPPYNMPRQVAPVSPQLNGNRARVQDRPQVSAWQNFHVDAQRDDAEERDRVLKEQKERQGEEARTDIRPRPQFTFEETFKQIETSEGLGRSITSVMTSAPYVGECSEVPNLDGCGASSLKRRRGTSSPELTEQQQNEHAKANIEHPIAVALRTLDGTAASSTAVKSATENNPDAVEINLDDTDSDSGLPESPEVNKPGSAAPSGMSSNHARPIPVSEIGAPTNTTNGSHNRPQSTSIFSDDGDDDGGVRLNPLPQSFQPLQSISPFLERKKSEDLNPLAQTFTSTSSVTEGRRRDEMHPPAQSFTAPGSVASLAKPQNDRMSLDETITAEGQDASIGGHESRLLLDGGDNNQHDSGRARVIDNEVSEEMRAQLTALSGSFAPQQIMKSESLPFPEAITNKTTHFLALDKCETNREFLQLLEVEPISGPPIRRSPYRLFKLEYDPEWLAILRVFAPDLELGGNPTKTMAPDRGEAYYRDRIAEEAEWVNEHIVQKDLLDIPENFTTTAPIFDPNLRVDSLEMPREYTNPQTSEFCKLLGIENKFDMSEQERDARMARGPRPDTDRQDFRFGGREGRGRGGSRGRFNNNRGSWRGGGRGRGRARR
jgi:hypothetical protein